MIMENMKPVTEWKNRIFIGNLFILLLSQYNIRTTDPGPHFIYTPSNRQKTIFVKVILIPRVSCGYIRHFD